MSPWREVVVDQPPKLPSLGGGFANRDVVSEVPIESEKAYSGHLVPRHDYVPSGPPFTPEGPPVAVPMRGKVELSSDYPRRNSRTVAHHAILPKLEPAPTQLRDQLRDAGRDGSHELVSEGVAALFYPLDGSILGPSSSARPHLGPLSSKPPATALRKARHKLTRGTWAVIALIALAAGTFAFLRRSQKPRSVSSAAPAASAAAVTKAPSAG